MIDLEDRLRKTLRRKALTVPAVRAVPVGLIRRVLRRIARNGAGLVVLVAAASLGTVTGLHALSAASRPSPASVPPARACVRSDLSGTARLDVVRLSREGSLVLTNTGRESCALGGTPTVRVLDAQGTALPQDVGSVEQLWRTRGYAQPRGWPVVTLQPGASAGVHVLWESWCGNTHAPATWEVLLRDGGGVRFGVDVRQGVPACSDGTSTLKVGPFEPYSA
jgi:hypothetical protein